VGPCLPLSRVLALIGGLSLMTAFFMPWFASQGLLLSGQFLNDFLASATPADLQRFMPGTSASEARLLRGLVDLFAACGACAAMLSVLIALPFPGLKLLLRILLVLTGAVPLAAWAIGIARLPANATFQVGLWLIACAALAVLIGGALELLADRTALSNRG
jgi:hypothetical protein